MDNIVKTSGTTEPYKLNPGGSISYPFAVKGIVKQNVDNIRTGRIKVYITDFGAKDPNDSSAWVTVSYLSPFYGFLSGDYSSNTPSTGYGTFLENPHSYGFWATSPDIGSEVVCLFLYGKKDFGYYIGCIPKPGVTQMVPAIGATNNVIMEAAEAEKFGGATNLPTCEMNIKNTQLYNTPTFYDQAKPVHKVMSAQLWRQGIIRDPVRGTITSSSTRESPSNVFGISTPGRPIYKGTSGTSEVDVTKNLDSADPEQAKIVGRRGGHTFVLDDGDFFGQNNLVRIRSASGHQITMSDDGQTLFIIHSNGQSYIELGKEGTVDIYATNSFNVRTKGDLNLHADNNININAKKQLNIFAEEININSDKNTNLRVGGNFSQHTVKNHTVKVDGSMSFLSASNSSFKSDAVTYINGSKVNLNTGSSPLTPSEIKPIVIIQHSDTLFDPTQGWVPAPAKLPSINSRVPTHTPWTDANKGVNVKIDETASGNFPSAPSSKIQNANNAVSNTPVTVTTPSIASTVPNIESAKGNFDKNTTSVAVSQAAVTAGNDPIIGPTALNGGGIVTDNGNKKAVLGKLGHSPKQLEEAGYIKPGASVIANNLVQDNKSLEQAMPSNLFTGKDGITSATDYNKRVSAQTTAQVKLMNNGYDQLLSAGVIQGNESPTQVAGLVNGVAAYGIGPVQSFVNNAGGVSSTPLTQNNNGQIASTISAGNYAVNMAEKILSPVGTMVSSVIRTGAAIGSAIVGAASTVFSAIKNSYTKLTAGQPQNLASLNSANTSNTGEVVGGLYGGENAISNNVTSSYWSSPTTANISGTLESASNGLVSTVTSNVPTDQLASLQSASKAISSNGSSAGKMPTAAVNTINTASIKEETIEIYNDTRIVPPYSDITSSKVPNAEILEQYNDLRIQLDVQTNIRNESRIKYREAIANYGSGSYQAVTALRDYKDAIREVEYLQTAIDAAYQELYT